MHNFFIQVQRHSRDKIVKLILFLLFFFLLISWRVYAVFSWIARNLPFVYDESKPLYALSVHNPHDLWPYLRIRSHIVTHSQRSDGSGYNDVSKCTHQNQRFLKMRRHTMQKYKDTHSGEILTTAHQIKILLSVSLLLQLFYQYSLRSLPSIHNCDLVHMLRVNSIKRHTHEKEDERSHRHIGVGISSPDNVMLSNSYTQMHTRTYIRVQYDHAYSVEWMLSVWWTRAPVQCKRAFQCAKSKQCWNVVHIIVKGIVVVSCAILVVFYSTIHLTDTDAYRLRPLNCYSFVVDMSV